MKSAKPGRVGGKSLAAGSFAIVMIASSAAFADVSVQVPFFHLPDTGGPERLLSVQAAAGTPVSYSAEQADRGEERYLKECEDCHGGDLRGGMNGGAPLRGLAFEQKYAEGVQASVMFDYMMQTMPPNQPGRYSAAVYADLMAYILKRNGFRPGAPLPSDLDALDNLIVAK